ncbi:NADH-quinone oxidoreductase subunit C [Patescibacteria group bacterium]|nr:NADH-quinone oxidoreductase subunit C [Patescibacteria group bacterium]
MNKQELIEKYIPTQSSVEEKNNLLLFEVSVSEIETVCQKLYFADKMTLMTMTAIDERKENNSFKIFYVFGLPGEKFFLVPYLKLQNTEEFPSLVKVIHETSWYEREIMTMFGLQIVGHYYPEKVLLHENWPANVFPLRKDFPWNKKIEMAHEKSHRFKRVGGEGIYEVPVGPVHAGIIEPGHFRFSMLGEEIINLEPLLGYTHKGSEKLFEVLPLEKKIALSERISGDSSFGHSLAFCQSLELIGDISAPLRAKYLRVIFAELERIANHFNDIGFIMLDAGFSFGGSNGARLREMIMQINQRLTDSRFLRGVNTIGGVKKEISDLMEITSKLKEIEKDFKEFINIALDSSSLINRLKGTGSMDSQIAKDHGVCGVSAKALGILSDARINFSYAAYSKLNLSIAIEKEGDVYARFMVRVKEVSSSFSLIYQALNELPAGEIKTSSISNFKKNSLAIGIAEGWRGSIVYFVATDNEGKISRVQARDASFLNWSVLPHVAVGSVLLDFPLINKSFNLSYSGYDR